jgi:hypothetical protein
MTINSNNNDIKALSNMSITELKQLLSCVNQDIKSIKRRENAAKKAPVLSELAECNIIAQRFTGNKALPIEHNKKLKADIAIQSDILDYLNNGGHIVTAKRRNKVKCQTFRNNKYSIANQGHQASITGKYGFFASPNKVSL